jgi:hypothetical protein
VFELDYLEYLDEALNEAFEVELALKENLLNNVKKTKYDNKFVMPLEILTDEFDSHLYIDHLLACVSKMVEIYSDKPNL